VEAMVQQVRKSTLNGLRDAPPQKVQHKPGKRRSKSAARNRPQRDPLTGAVAEAPMKRSLSVRMWADIFIEWPLELKKNLVKHTRNTMADAFSTHDKNSDGRVTRKEFGAALKQLKVAMEESTFHRLMESQDPLARNRIDFREFIQAINDYKGWLGSIKQLVDAVRHMGRHDRTMYGRPLRSVMDIFHAMDRDQGGEISLGEFREGLRRLDIGLSPSAIEHLLTVFDLDGNGDVDTEEFSTTLRVFGGESDKVFTRTRNLREERGLTTSHQRRKKINPMLHKAQFGTTSLNAESEAAKSKEAKRIRRVKDQLSDAYSSYQEADLMKRQLFAAVEEGRLAEVKRLVLDEGLEPGLELTRGQTLLHLACYHGHFHIAKFLALSGADVWALDDLGNLPASLLASDKHRNELYLLANYVMQGDDDGASLSATGTGRLSSSLASPYSSSSVARTREMVQAMQSPLGSGGIGSAGGLKTHKAGAGLAQSGFSSSHLPIREWKEVIRSWDPIAKRTLFGYTGRGIETAFREVDKDRDGFVTAEEFASALHRLRVHLPPGTVHAAFSAVEVGERAGHVDYVGLAHCISKYKCWILSVKHAMDGVKHQRALFTKELPDLQATFRSADTNRDGELDGREFQAGLQELGVDLTTAQVEEMMSAFDLDGNGRLDINEFLEAIRAYQSPDFHESQRPATAQG